MEHGFTRKGSDKISYFRFGAQPLDGARGDLPFGAKPVEVQLPVVSLGTFQGYPDGNQPADLLFSAGF